MQHWISVVALVLAVLSFVVFAITIILPPVKSLESKDTLQASAIVDLEGLAKLIDSLSKAGPSALIAHRRDRLYLDCHICRFAT